MAPTILCAVRHVAPSASGSSNNGSSKQKLEEKPSQFVTSNNSIRPSSAMQIVIAATSCLSTVVPQPAAYRNHHHRFEMAMAPRPKQVTDPLNEMVRARLCGDNYHEITNYGSSGSEHDPDSVCLADMVYGFMEEEENDDEGGMENNEVGNCGRSRCNCLNGTGEPCSDNIAEVKSVDGDSNAGLAEDDSNDFLSAELKEVLEGLLSSCINNPVEVLLHKEAVRALEIIQNEADNPNANNFEVINQKSRLRRSVMNHLRGLGYNAGICKSRWERIGGFPAGNYEYIDVIIDEERFFVDIDFRVEFEIARPTSVFDALLWLLPNVYVGKAERLKQVIRIMCDSAKKSLQERGLHLPPWRKYRYMQTKWFGPYKRTTNAMTNSTPDTYCNKSSLARELGSIALKGTGWDHGFQHRMDLTMHFEKGDSRLKLKANSADEIAAVVTDWTPPVFTSRPALHANVSGLASALKEAGVTCSFRSQNALQKQQRA